LVRILLIIIAIIPLRTFSQNESSILNQSSDPESVASHFYRNFAKDEDKHYLYDDWRKGIVYFNSGVSIGGFPLRYDLRFNLLEINLHDDIMVQTINKIEWFMLLDDYTRVIEKYMSCEEFKFKDGSSINGICKMDLEGDFSLVTNLFCIMKGPDHIKALDAGNKEMKVFTKNRILLCIDHTAFIKPKKENSIIHLFGPDSLMVSQLVKEEKLNLRKKKDMLFLLKYMNSNE